MRNELASFFDELTKIADEAVQYTPAQSAQVRRRFARLQAAVRSEGVLAGTAHRRLLVPKDKMTEADIQHLGFVPVTIAIPEAGQDRFQSFRHPDNNFHIHSHPEGWTMHEDQHAAATMLAKKVEGLGQKAKAMAAGVPHASEEGLPGLYYYAKGVLGGHKSTAQRVAGELPAAVKARISGWKPSPTFQPPEVASSAAP